MEEAQIAIPLANANDDFFVFKACACSAPFVFAANVGFVHFDRAVQHGLVNFVHGRSDAMAEVPGRLVADSERPLHLAGRHAFLGFAEQADGDKPLFQRQMGVVKNRSGGYGELIEAGRALELIAGLKPCDAPFLATRAGDTFRPAQLGENLAALVIGGVQVH